MRAGFVVIALVAAGAAAACGSASPSQDRSTPAASRVATERPAATPAIEPAATKSSCPTTAEVCDFARRTERQLAERDIAGVVDDAPGRLVTCTTGVNPGLGADFPLCNGASPGEVRFGFEFGRFQSEGTTTDRAGLEYQLNDWLGKIDATQSDTLGDGPLRTFTIGCASNIDCSTGVSVVFSAILRGAVREFLMLTFTRAASTEWNVVGMHTGIAKLNMGYLTGGAVGGLSPGDPNSPRLHYLPIGG